MLQLAAHVRLRDNFLFFYRFRQTEMTSRHLQEVISFLPILYFFAFP